MALLLECLGGCTLFHLRNKEVYEMSLAGNILCLSNNARCSLFPTPAMPDLWHSSAYNMMDVQYRNQGRAQSAPKLRSLSKVWPLQPPLELDMCWQIQRMLRSQSAICHAAKNTIIVFSMQHATHIANVRHHAVRVASCLFAKSVPPILYFTQWCNAAMTNEHVELRQMYKIVQLIRLHLRKRWLPNVCSIFMNAMPRSS